MTHAEDTTSSSRPSDSGGAAPRRLASTAAWWIATLLVLIVLDDLTFGPVFWVISRVGGGWIAFSAALVIYVPAQIVLVWRATGENAGRLSKFLLRRFDLERRSSQVHAREQQIRARVTGVLTALVMSLLIGGVLPPLTLWRAGYSTAFVRRVAPATATIYAVEFALLHGLLPGSL